MRMNGVWVRDPCDSGSGRRAAGRRGIAFRADGPRVATDRARSAGGHAAAPGIGATAPRCRYPGRAGTVRRSLRLPNPAHPAPRDRRLRPGYQARFTESVAVERYLALFDKVLTIPP